MHPGIDLTHAVVGHAFQPVAGTLGQQLLELLPDGRQVPLFERQHVTPVVLLSDLQHSAASEQAVAGQHQPRLRKRLLELRRQTAERFQFTILLGYLQALALGGVAVDDEFAADR